MAVVGQIVLLFQTDDDPEMAHITLHEDAFERCPDNIRECISAMADVLRDGLIDMSDDEDE